MTGSPGATAADSGVVVGVPFTPSDRGTIGLEWELFVTDAATGALAPRASELLDAVGATDSGPIVGEYLTTMIELVSGVHANVDDAVAEMRALLTRVVDAASGLGLGILAAGTHPCAQPGDAPVRPGAQYDTVAERNAWWGRRMLICGTHVHVGVPVREWALPLTHFLAQTAPVLLALSASSPYFGGEDTGFASQRTMLFQQLPTNGLPPDQVRDWPAFESYVADLRRGAMAAQATEIRWDVRPAPKFGTVEHRVADCSTTGEELGVIAAWSQCLTEWFFRRLEAGEPPAQLAPWFVRENKWRAARYGLDALVIPPTGVPVALRDEVTRWLEELTPLAAELGCADALAATLTVLTRGNPAERQRALAASGADPAAITLALMAETRASLSAPNSRNSPKEKA
ncbi:MAG: YbdK family carboxylate-amine ligase [Propionibacteriaceae bacterium]|nr:YbdK family carboxylate-amine ligase [Propionibacteriaceae bacterium]